jgi:hypothetical protein
VNDLLEKLLPAYYLSVVAEKTKDIAQREQLQQKSAAFPKMLICLFLF